MSEKHQEQKPRRRWLWFGLVPVFALASWLLPRAYAHGGHGGWHRRGPGHVDPEEARETARFFLGRALKKVEATPAQRAAVEEAVDAVLPSLLALRGERLRLRDELRATLAADNVDTAKLESLRQDALRLVDRASAEVVGALGKASSELTAEQRQRLLELLAEHHRH